MCIFALLLLCVLQEPLNSILRHFYSQPIWNFIALVCFLPLFWAVYHWSRQQDQNFPLVDVSEPKNWVMDKIALILALAKFPGKSGNTAGLGNKYTKNRHLFLAWKMLWRKALACLPTGLMRFKTNPLQLREQPRLCIMWLMCKLNILGCVAYI